MMNDYKFNKLLSDTITLPILPANKFTNTDTEYYAVLEKNYIPIESSITCIYKPDWITGYKFTTEDKYYNRLTITSIKDNTEKKLHKGIMEFICTNNIVDDPSKPRFISGINHIYAKVSQAPYEEFDVRLEFIPTASQKELTNKETWDDKKEHIIGGKISGDEQELHIKYYGILNDINQSNVILLINDKQLDTNNIKSLKTTVQNEIDLIYLIDENINTVDKKLKFTVIFKTTYNSKQKDYYITQGYNNYILKLGIDSINNITADNILYQGEEKKLIYTFSLNDEYKQSDDLEVYFEFINNTYELNYQTGITSYIDNQYNLNLTINPNYTLQKRKVKVYVIYKNKIKSNEIILIQTYDTNMRLYYEIDSITYDSASTFKVTPFGKDISLYYYARTMDGHIITSMSNIKYIDNIEITEYDEINYTRTDKNLTNNIKDIDNDLNDTKKLLYLQFPLLTEFINQEIYISISLSTLKLNNITFIQQVPTQTKVNINKNLSTDTIGGIPQFSEIKIGFNAVNTYENETSIVETSIVIDSNLFNINFYQKNQDVYTLANSMFDLDNIEYENTKDTDDYLIAQNIRLKNEYYNVAGNRVFYYQISYILGNTEIYRTDYIKITQESLQYECKLVSDTNIISFEGNNNFIVKGYGILYNNQDEKNKGTSSNAYYTTYLTSVTKDENSDNILNSQMKLIKASDYTNIKLDIKNIDNTNVNNNQKIKKLIIRGKYRYNTTSNIAEDVLTLCQTYIKLNLELYSNSSLDDQLTYNKSTNTNENDCYIIENILQDTVLYFKYYMQESIIENGNVKLVNVDLKNYNSDLTINLNNLTVWTQHNLMPYTSNIIYNEDENYYYGILNIPQNLLTCDNKIILKYIQNYKDIDYAYTQFVLYKDRVDTLKDNNTVYRDNHDEYAYISHYRITGVEGITISAAGENNLMSIVQYEIDTTKVTDFIIYYNVIYKYIDKTLIDTTLNNFYKGISLMSSYTPYYEKSEQFIETKDSYNYIGQKITMLENVNDYEYGYFFLINYNNNYKKSNIKKIIQLIQKSATRAYNLSSLIDDQYEQNDENKKIQIYGVRHKEDNNNGKFLEIPVHTIYCDPSEQTLTLYIGLYCNNHVDHDYKQPFETGKIEYTDIKITKDMFNLSEDNKKYVSITDPVYNNDASNGYYEFNVTLSDIALQTEDTSIELKYSRNYKNYNYNYNKFEEASKDSNILKIVRFAYNTTNYTLYIGFHTLNSLTDSDGKSTKINNNVSKGENELYVLFYLIKKGDSTKLDLTNITYDFTLTLNNEDIKIDFSQINKNDDNVYSYFYTLPNNISESSRDLSATININSNLKSSDKITQDASEYNVIIRDSADFKDGKDIITKENGKQIYIPLYFKGGPTDGSFDDDLSHYNIICSDINVTLDNNIEKYNNTCFKVNVNIPENDSITDSKSYEIKVLYQSNNSANVHEDKCTINQEPSKIGANLNIIGHSDNDEINITGETLTLECYGTLNDDEKAEGTLICSDSSITIPKSSKSGNKLIYQIEIPISTTKRELTFTFTYTFHDNKVSTSKTLQQKSGNFTLYIFAYYNDKEDNEQLNLDSSANGQFTIRYYSQYENGETDVKNLDSYILSYDKFTDEEQNTYEYLKGFSLKTEKQLNKKTDIITSIDSSGNKYEIKKPDITGIENTYNFSKNDDDDKESTDKAIKFTVKYRDKTESIIVFQQSSLTTHLADFDYLIFHYILDQNNSAEKERNQGDNTITDDDIKIYRNNGAGSDMDTVTRITNNKNFKIELKGDLDSSFILNNTTIGYGCTIGNSTYNTVTNYSSFFKFSDDNRSTTGEESVFIYVKKIVDNIIMTYPDIIKKCRYLYFDLFGHWWSAMYNGKVKITYETYKIGGTTPSLQKNGFIISSVSPDVEANEPVNIDAYIYIQYASQAYNTLMARLEYDLKTGEANLKPMSISGYYSSNDSNDVLVANRTVSANPNVVYINNTLYQLQYSNNNDVIIITKTIMKSQINETSIELFDFSTYYYSLITKTTWRVWKYFKNFYIKQSDNQGLIFNSSGKKLYLNANRSYSSVTWPTSNDNTRTITVTSEPEIPGFTFNIKIIEQKSN